MQSSRGTPMVLKRVFVIWCQMLLQLVETQTLARRKGRLRPVAHEMQSEGLERERGWTFNRTA